MRLLFASLICALAIPATASAAGPEFAPPREVATATGVGSLTELEPGDLNGDGHPDVVVTRIAYPLAYATFPIGIFLGDGTGGFQDGASLFDGSPPRTQHGRQIVIADFNGDARDDLFVADHGYDAMPFPGHQNALALSTPDARLVDATSNLPPASDFSHSAAAADIDGDGDQDIYVGNLWGGDSPPYLLLNDGSGHFVRGAGLLPDAQTDRNLNRYSRSRFLDVNGDAGPDLILGAENNTSNSVVLSNDGTGHFAVVPNALPAKEFGPTAITISTATLNINHDSAPDLILGFQRQDFSGRRLQVLIGNGDGTFRDETSARLPEPPDENSSWPYAIRVGDLNSDERADFSVVANGMPEPVVLYLDDGSGIFRPHRPAGLQTSTFALVDADTDGRLDVFSSLGGTVERHFVHRQLTDDDADGVEFAADNCPSDANADQGNVDKDALGDACDPDDDGDGAPDAADNCAVVVNPDQADRDGDQAGDACDPDDDGDGVPDTGDACPALVRAAFNGCPGATLTTVGAVKLRRSVVRTGVRASCPAAGTTCAGRGVLKHRSKVIGRSRFSLASGRGTALSVPLNRAGKRLLRDGRRRRVKITLELTGPDRQKITLGRSARLAVR
jgi:hypothetical protein